MDLIFLQSSNLPSTPLNLAKINKPNSGGIHMKPTYSPPLRDSSTPKLSVMSPYFVKVSERQILLIVVLYQINRNSNLINVRPPN